MDIRRDLKKWKEYAPVKSAESISIARNIKIEKLNKLDSGESVFGPSPIVLRNLSRFKGYQFYPDPEYTALRMALSTYSGASRESIFVSNGADELIDLVLRILLEIGDEVIDCPPTFSSYSLSAKLNRGTVVNVNRKTDYSLDVKGIIKVISSKTKIIFICSPNNPTGNSTAQVDIEAILKTGIYVCVDEAYIEFGGNSIVPLLNTYKNLIIIRSFSKWAGIAGLRLGYGLMSPYLVKQLMKIKSPYNVNYAAVIAGIASLKDNRYRDYVVKTVKSERMRIETIIGKMNPFELFNSKGNFIFLRTSVDIQKRIQQECIEKKFSFRFYSSQATGTALRITIGKSYQNNGVIAILKKCI